MSSKVGNKFLIIGSLIVIVLIVLFLYISLPFIFMGSPTPIFQIFNDDIKSHEVTVEVFNPDNESIINKTYNLEPGSDFLEDRPLSLWLPQAKGEYMFKVTMDKQITNTVKIEIPNKYTGVSIRLYSKNYESGENIPILIETTEKL